MTNENPEDMLADKLLLSKLPYESYTVIENKIGTFDVASGAKKINGFDVKQIHGKKRRKVWTST